MDSVPIGSQVEDVANWNPTAHPAEKEFTYIDIGAIDQDSRRIVGAKAIRCADAPSRARQIVSAGDVLVSTVRPNLNAVALVPDGLDGATASTGFCVLRPNKDSLVSSYLFHWVKTPGFVAEMTRLATGAGYPAVTEQVVLDSRIPLPPLAEQRRIAAILDQADALRAKRRQALTELNTLTQSIFLEMFGDPVANPRNWPNSATLGDVAEIVSGITKGRRLNGGPTRSVPYLAVANVQDKALSLGAVKRIDATEAEIQRYRLRRHDLLLTEGGDPDKLGRGTLWNDEIDECIHQNHVFRVRLKSNDVHAMFLKWLVSSERGKAYFFKAAKQTTGIASINKGQLSRFPMLIPPRSLQAKFSDRVAVVQQAVAQAERSSRDMDSLFASLQKSAFRGSL